MPDVVLSRFEGRLCAATNRAVARRRAVRPVPATGKVRHCFRRRPPHLPSYDDDVGIRGLAVGHDSPGRARRSGAGWRQAALSAMVPTPSRRPGRDPCAARRRGSVGRRARQPAAGAPRHSTSTLPSSWASRCRRRRPVEMPPTVRRLVRRARSCGAGRPRRQVVCGVGIGTGVVRGRACVLDEPGGMAELRPGDVIVATMTTAGHNAIFPLARGPWPRPRAACSAMPPSWPGVRPARRARRGRPARRGAPRRPHRGRPGRR